MCRPAKFRWSRFPHGSKAAQLPRSDVEDLVLSGIWLEQVLNTLTEEERRIVQEFYINGKNEREACAALGLPKTTFRRREQRLREKLGILLKNFL